MQRIANNINMLKSHCYVTSNLQLVIQNTANAVILTRYFVTLSCKSHSIHIQDKYIYIYIYIHINNSKQIHTA